MLRDDDVFFITLRNAKGILLGALPVPFAPKQIQMRIYLSLAFAQAELFKINLCHLML